MTANPLSRARSRLRASSLPGLAAARRTSPNGHGGTPSSSWTVELLAGILVWGGVGYMLDQWLSTGPWLLAIGCMVGNGAGLYLLWLRSNPAANSRTQEGHEVDGCSCCLLYTSDAADDLLC